MTEKNSPPPPAAARANVPTDLPLAHIHAARSMQTCGRPFDPGATADEMLAELHRAFIADGDCESLMFMQAQVLDATFHRALAKALANHFPNNPAANCLDGHILNLALRAQKQSRQAALALQKLREAGEEK